MSISEYVPTESRMMRLDLDVSTSHITSHVIPTMTCSACVVVVVVVANRASP